MHQVPQTRSLPGRLFCIPILLLIVTAARAERLPVTTYTTADGLLRDNAYCIVQDSRGFLWFCTSDGLSRFDGYSFMNYTTDDGLPHRVVNSFLETRRGVYWVATNDGLARFIPQGQHGASSGKDRMFITYTPKANKPVNVLFEDRQGRLWCGTEEGLYSIEDQEGNVVFHHFDLPVTSGGSSTAILAIAEAPHGDLWIGSDGQGLYRITPVTRSVQTEPVPIGHSSAVRHLRESALNDTCQFVTMRTFPRQNSPCLTEACEPCRSDLSSLRSWSGLR